MPPLTLTVALPVLLPKQFTSVCVLMPALNAAAGSVMVTFCVRVQPRVSVTVTV